MLARPIHLFRRVLPFLGLVVPFSTAAAHPRLERSAPAAESRLTVPPKQLALTFNESLDLALTRVTLHRGADKLALDSLQLATGDDRTVTARIASVLSPGRYTVKWQVTGDDGHPTRGEFSFEVLAAGSAPAPATPRSPRR